MVFLLSPVCEIEPPMISNSAKYIVNGV